MGTNLLDAELVKRVQAGDKAAFDILVLKYQHKVVNLIARFVSDQTECYDIAQDAFIKAYRAIGNFRGDSQFYTWLYRIAANTAKNHLASRARKSSNYTVDVEDAEHFEGESGLKEYTTPENLSIRSIKVLSANINSRNPIQNRSFSPLFTVMPENSCTVRASS